MSHLTKLKLNLDNKVYLLKALDKLGYHYMDESGLQTSNKYISKQDVDILLTGSMKSHVGFKEDETGCFNAVGDFYGTKTPDGRSLYNNEDTFNKEITAVAKESEAVDRLAEMGFSEVEGSRTIENNTIKLKLERWTD